MIVDNGFFAVYNVIGFRGYYLDSETGWYFLNARYYSPEWRRFISPDDTAYLDPESVNGLNLYCYCNNDPVNYADPSGREPMSTITAMILFYGILLVLLGGTAIYLMWQDEENKKLPPKISIFPSEENTLTNEDVSFYTQGLLRIASSMSVWGGPGLNVAKDMFDIDYFGWLDFR